jgi:hypothetical protein
MLKPKSNCGVTNVINSSNFIIFTRWTSVTCFVSTGQAYCRMSLWHVDVGGHPLDERRQEGSGDQSGGILLADLYCSEALLSGVSVTLVSLKLLWDGVSLALLSLKLRLTID